MKKLILFVIAFASLGLGVHAQNVNIPDINFKAYLVGNTAINTNLDAEIQVSEASAFTGSISCWGLGITDLTGIEEFTALTVLWCGGNSIATLDVSNNLVLTSLYCSQNGMTSLNIAGCNQITELRCFDNQLTTLDVTTLTSLLDLRCYLNQLSTLNVINNTALDYFSCSNNQLSSLDISNNVSLLTLNCSTNNITTLDVSANPGLTTLVCFENLLVDLDVSANVVLNEFICNTNSLTSLNIANGNNSSMTGSVYLDGNPNLTCIQVDDAVYSTANWTNVDVTSTFSENCGVGINEIESMEINIYPNPTSDQINISSEDQIETILIFDMFGSLVQSENTSTFSVENLANGIYQIVLKTDKGIVRSGFVKE